MESRDGMRHRTTRRAGAIAAVIALVGLATGCGPLTIPSWIHVDPELSEVVTEVQGLPPAVFPLYGGFQAELTLDLATILDGTLNGEAETTYGKLSNFTGVVSQCVRCGIGLWMVDV